MAMNQTLMMKMSFSVKETEYGQSGLLKLVLKPDHIIILCQFIFPLQKNQKLYCGINNQGILKIIIANIILIRSKNNKIYMNQNYRMQENNMLVYYLKNVNGFGQEHYKSFFCQQQSATKLV